MRHLPLLFLLMLSGACTREASPLSTVLRGKVPVGTENARFRVGDDGWKDLTLADDGTFVDTVTITDPSYVDLSLDHETDARRYGAYRSLVGLILDQRAENPEDTTLSTLEAHLAVLKEIKRPYAVRRSRGDRRVNRRERCVKSTL